MSLRRQQTGAPFSEIRLARLPEITPACFQSNSIASAERIRRIHDISHGCFVISLRAEELYRFVDDFFANFVHGDSLYNDRYINSRYSSKSQRKP
jgi:hypothetical protein